LSCTKQRWFSRCGAIDERLEFFTSPATENILSTGTEEELGVREKLAKALNFGYTSQ